MSDQTRREVCYTLVVLILITIFTILHTKAADVVSGRGIVCDTAEQVERFIEAKDTHEFLVAVNTEKAHSCAVVDVAFYIGSVVKTVRNDEGGWAITHILIVGAKMGDGFGSVQPTPQFTAFLVPEVPA